MFIEPPESHVLTDEDSADEDDGGFADNLSSRQLTAGAEIRFTNSKRYGGFADDLGSDLHLQNMAGPSSNDDMTQGNNAEKTNKSTLKIDKVPTNPKFCDGDLLSINHYFPDENYSMYENMTCCELFELFFY